MFPSMFLIFVAHDNEHVEHDEVGEHHVEREKDGRKFIALGTADFVEHVWVAERMGALDFDWLVDIVRSLHQE